MYKYQQQYQRAASWARGGLSAARPAARSNPDSTAAGCVLLLFNSFGRKWRAMFSPDSI